MGLDGRCVAYGGEEPTIACAYGRRRRRAAYKEGGAEGVQNAENLGLTISISLLAIRADAHVSLPEGDVAVWVIQVNRLD